MVNTEKSDTETCLAEDDLIDYISGRVDKNKQEKLELHISQCDICCQKLAAFARFTSVQEPIEDILSEDLLELYKQVEARTDMQIERALKSSSVELSMETNLVTKVINFLQRVFTTKLLLRPAIVIPMILIISGSVLLSVFYSTPNPDFERGVRAFQQSVQNERFSRFRLAKLEYAPYNPLRGNDTGKEAIRIRENIELAIRLLKSADTKKETYETKHRLGQSLFIAGKYKEAIEELEKASTLSLDNVDIINDLAVAYAANRDLAEAKAQISKALKIKPDYLPSIFNRSLIYEILDKENEAIESWNEYLSLDNSSRWRSEAEDSKKELEKTSK